MFASCKHPITLRTWNGYGASASRGVSIYAPAFADTEFIAPPREDGRVSWLAEVLTYRFD